ncbi:hypothetical protein ABTE93_20070, partial [Acinetobacter baumannii]
PKKILKKLSCATGRETFATKQRYTNPTMLSPRPPASHILAYAQTLDGGGVEKALLRLVRSWSEVGRRVTLVLGDVTGPLSRDLPTGIETRIL